MISSRGAAFSRASTRTWTGFFFACASMISNAWRTTAIALLFFPVYISLRIMLLMRRSTMFVRAFANGLFACRPPVCGRTIGERLM